LWRCSGIFVVSQKEIPDGQLKLLTVTTPWNIPHKRSEGIAR